MKVFGRILALLTPQERRRGMLVLAAAIVMAVVDTLGVASVMPFLAVLGNSGMIESNVWLARLYHLGGFASREDFLFALGLLALSMVLVAALVRTAGQYAILRYVNMRRYSISLRMMKGYLGQPYIFFVGRNSADLTSRMLSDVDGAVEICLSQVLQIVAYSLVIVMLIALLVAIDPVLVAVAFSIIAGFYLILYFSGLQSMRHAGRDRRQANHERFTITAEVFSDIKSVKLYGCEGTFLERFQAATLRFARHKALMSIFGLLPRYFLEAVSFGSVLVLALVLMRSHGDLGAVLPIMGVYAFAGYRLLPAVQTVYQGFIDLRFHLPAIEAIGADLQLVESIRRDADTDEILPLRQTIKFDDVAYCYPGAPRPVFSNLNFEIRVGETIGLVGPTGVGKTTAVDLLLGLLWPSQGRILIDGVALTDENHRAWQKNLGYVPQTILLADASIAENIAFGIPPEAIDRSAVEHAAKLANIHDFIVSELPKGYDTAVGERGVRLSGGQCQRIGIARALYRDPPVLVFDEATSALDTVTEAAVMEAINALQGQKTMIIIAHREATVRKCDRIFQFRKGAITGVNIENEQVRSSE
jgi:ABC-type multidrug transport system fused ATPase/permease subunit